MTQTETATPSTTNSRKTDHKKQLRKEIYEKLTGALSDYKKELGDKKLATHVKKASKLISRDLEKISKKQAEQRKKKSAPKVAKQKPAKNKA